MHRYLALVAAAIGGLVTWKHVRTRSAENAMWDQVTHTVKKHS
ncbi:DLW-39 family protein [Dermatophilus congolensis]|nr:DLW-39 family protein [Dermatophilus congolensis]